MTFGELLELGLHGKSCDCCVTALFPTSHPLPHIPSLSPPSLPPHTPSLTLSPSLSSPSSPHTSPPSLPPSPSPLPLLTLFPLTLPPSPSPSHPSSPSSPSHSLPHSLPPHTPSLTLSPLPPLTLSPLTLPPSPSTLTAHYLEVLAVVEHAERDVAIERLLKTLEEVWLSRQLELRPYQRAAGLSRQEVRGRLGDPD